MKVNYNKNFGVDGTVYTQTITIGKDIMEGFNKIVREKKEKLSKKNEDMKEKCYLEELKEGNNYTYLTTLSCFIEYYKNKIVTKDDDLKRVLYRNTIIKVI